MAFEVEIHFNQTLIPFKYIEFGFDKVKVQQYCSCLIYVTNIHVPLGSFSNCCKTNMETKSVIYENKNSSWSF